MRYGRLASDGHFSFLLYRHTSTMILMAGGAHRRSVHVAAERAAPPTYSYSRFRPVSAAASISTKYDDGFLRPLDELPAAAMKPRSPLRDAAAGLKCG